MVLFVFFNLILAFVNKVFDGWMMSELWHKTWNLKLFAYAPGIYDTNFLNYCKAVTWRRSKNSRKTSKIRQQRIEARKLLAGKNVGGQRKNLMANNWDALLGRIMRKAS